MLEHSIGCASDTTHEEMTPISSMNTMMHNEHQLAYCLQAVHSVLQWLQPDNQYNHNTSTCRYMLVESSSIAWEGMLLLTRNKLCAQGTVGPLPWTAAKPPLVSDSPELHAE